MMRIKSELVRNSSVLLGGNVLGQGIAFLAYPVLTRIYSDADFGVFATFTSVCSILTVLGTARYEEALVVAGNRKETSALLGFSLKWLMLFSLILFAVLALFRKPVLKLFNLEAIEIFWYYIPMTIFVTGLLYLLNNLATREKYFKEIAFSGLSQNIVNTLGKLVFGFLTITRIGFVVSNLLSIIAGNACYRFSVKQVKEALKTPWKSEINTAKKYVDFPTFNLGRLFIGNLSLNLPFLLLIGIFGDVALGLFSLAFTLLYRPLSLISASLFTALFENISITVRNKKTILPSLKKYWKNLCLYILPCFVIAFCIARPFFSFVFGESWKASGVYFQYLLPWMFMMMMVSPINFLPIVFGKQKELLFLEGFFLILRFSALYLGIATNNFQTSIVLFSTVGFFFSLVLFFWFYSLIKGYEKRIESFSDKK